MNKNVLTIVVPVRVVNTGIESFGDVPYGPAVINGILKHNGYNSKVWDLNIDLFSEFADQWNIIVDMFAIRGYRPANSINILKILKWLRKAVKQQIKNFNPDTILLSVFSSQSLDFVVPLSTIVREISPNSYIMIGGRGLDNNERISGINYANYFMDYLPIDSVYRGDAENDLISVIQNKKKGIHTAPPVSAEALSNTPAPSWEGYNFSLYPSYKNKNLTIPVTGSKGCVRECTFCDVQSSWPKFVYRKGNDIAREIIETHSKYGINKFEFTDNLVNGSITNYRLMNTVLTEEIPNRIEYSGYAICRSKISMPESDFKLASTAGAKLFKVGIESGSEKVRNDMKKKFSNEDITWFAENCFDKGIKQVWLMFVGYPTETEDDFQQSIDLLKTHAHLTTNNMIKVFLSLPMVLTNGSGFMQRYADEYGLEHNRHDQWGDFFWTSTQFVNNTFDVRVNRWKRFVEVMQEYGYYSEINRQNEKLLEIEGLEQKYLEHKQNDKKVIPIVATPFNVY